MNMFSFTKIVIPALLATVLFGTTISLAEETTGEKIETAKNKTLDSVKKTYRNAKDEVCETIDGKVTCVAKKIKHKVQNGVDNAETKATELKNKAN